jgi:hypothetical protein
MSNPLGLLAFVIRNSVLSGASGGKSISYVSPNDIAAVMAAAALDLPGTKEDLYAHWIGIFAEAQVQRLAAHLGHPVSTWT